ncbi:twin-arginine translocation signal domain-containing protein [Halogeometricum sp. S1BR25-6]|uniref:Twin-arginine translocation signal domain-containing protein n=1 Tax=Halogeometricum salsisoli TaxID=2950536 RepID=A0ABU2GM98_9EURY|nr:twin-arginine translocation signal domain-containing protein [Halogeometricum sp. S1BR25-6]MDS0301429.1 twin-arginine translocation signal domain-containing protein [Halogeometricum sp. S1BR25-6]
MADRRGIPRRDFMKSAVAIGGAAALSACLGRGSVDVPTGPENLSSLPRRQHAWNEVLPRDDQGNTVPPRHHVLLYLKYSRSGPPVEKDRKSVEKALRGVERAYERSGTGLLLTMSYSPAYFSRVDSALPESVDLPAPKALASFEDPELDTPDAVVHLASNNAPVVLGAEEALKGKKGTLNGIEQPDAALTDMFEVVDRRTGFVGDGLPAENAGDADGIPADKVPDDAPLFMGFKSGFEKNQASEDRVTIQSGPFAGGTTQHISKLQLNLNQWYNQDDRWQREAKMFCPYHAENDVVEGPGDNLGTSSQVEDCGPATETAREMGVVGHSQKMTSARENNSPVILRRDFDSTDGGQAGLHFLALQRGISDFVATREAMNGTDVVEQSAVGQRNNNGILQYVQTEHRGNYLVPPRPLRALPPVLPSENPQGVDNASS